MTVNDEHAKTIAAQVAERLGRTDCPKSWAPKVWTQAISGGRELVRVYLGAGMESFAYVTGDGRVRLSRAVPVRWLVELGKILGEEMGLLEVVRGGGMVSRRASEAKQSKAVRTC